MREAPELGELHLNLAPIAERKRTSHAIALDLRARLKSLTLPPGTVAQRGRGAARSAGAGHASCRSLRAGLDDPPRRRCRGEKNLRFGSLYRRHRRLRSASRSRGFASPSTRIGSNSSASSRATSTTRSRRCSAAPRSATRIAAKAAIRSRSPCGCPSATCRWSELLASTPVPANSVPGNKTVVELGDVVQRDRRSGLAYHLPPRRPLCRHGHGGTGRRLRGADLRHARRRQARSRRTTGARSDARPSASTASRRTKANRRYCGTANGRSPT